MRVLFFLLLCLHSSFTEESYPQRSPGPPTDLTVHALRAKSLEVRWNNPGNVSGLSLYSRAIAHLNGTLATTCNGTATPSSPDSCTLIGLKDLTKYDVWIQVCPRPVKSQRHGDRLVETCLTSSISSKSTLPSAPDEAENVRVLAVRTKELNVSWNIPKLTVGKLASSRAISMLGDMKKTECTPETKPNDQATCILSGLTHSTEYTVVVEVCVTPPDAATSPDSGADWCSRSAELRGRTLPEFPEEAENVRVLAVRTKELSVSWTIPKLVVGKLASSRAIAMLDDINRTECKPETKTKGQATCILSGLTHSTEYTVVVEVCVTPPDVTASHDSGAGWCSRTSGLRRRTLSEFPEAAVDVKVLAMRPGELNVSWIIPVLATGTLASSRAIAMQNKTKVSTCSVSDPANTCVLSGLSHSTEYTVVVEACVTPPDAATSPDSRAGWCSRTDGLRRRTLSESPEEAENVRVLAVRTKELSVSWTIPKLAVGKLASSRAIAMLDGLNRTECTPETKTKGQAECTLSGLAHSTEYTVVVEVCVTPPDAATSHDSIADWCSRTAGFRGQTLPKLPEEAENVRVLAVRTKELSVSWTTPKLAVGKLASSRAIAMLDGLNRTECTPETKTKGQATCTLSGLTHSTEYTVVVEVCVTPPDATASHDSDAGWCSRTSGLRRRTLSEFPEAAVDVKVLAMRPGELNVSWIIPVLATGTLASSRAIAMQNKTKVSTCSVSRPANTCVLSGLSHSTEYTVVVEACVTPPDAATSPDSSADWCSTTDGLRRRTLSEFPEEAEDVRVLAVRTKELDVSWTIPKLTVGTLASSRAVALLAERTVTDCIPKMINHRQAQCTLSGLAALAKYDVFIELCVTPKDAAYPTLPASDWCSRTALVSAETLPLSPEAATSVAVRAVQEKALSVSWINPNSVYGRLVSATATARPPRPRAVAANCSIADASPGPAACLISGLNDFTTYEVVVRLCVSPKDAKPSQDLRSTWCSESAPVRKRTIPGVPNSATAVHVYALATKELSVHWTNPSAEHGALASSVAVAKLDNKREATCSGSSTTAVTSTSCSLTGLMDFTVYNVTVHVCVSPLEVGRGDWAGGGCSATSPISKQTLPGNPDMAKNITVYARQRNSLQVSWLNPDGTHGPLVNATAIGFWQGKKLATCRASILPGQAVNCTLTNLEDVTEYAVSVEACVASVQAGLGGGCSMTPSISGITLPGVFEAEHLADLGRQITNSRQAVEDPSTQISIKVALSSLPTEHVGPVSYVTAYIEPANQTDLTRERRSAEKFSFLSGSYNNNTWEPWEVLVRDFRGEPSYKAEDFFFIIGQPSDSQTCDHCYNGPLAPDTLYRIGLRVYTDTGAGTTELSLLKTAPAPINIGLVAGCVSAALVIVVAVAVAVAVYFHVRKIGPGQKRHDGSRVFVAYKQKELPSWDRSEIPLPINFADFNLHVKSVQSEAEAMQEFLILNDLTNKQILEYGLTEDLAATVPKLNRYGDMTPYDQSIVRLDRSWVTYCTNQHPVGPLESEVMGVYVNANYVKACRYDSRGQAQIATDSSLPEYIATQGPLTHTEADFLYMVHQQRVPIVITLCNTLEGGKSKCAQYWPDSEGITEEKGNPLRSVDVTLNHETRTANVVTRSMTVKPEEEADSWTFTQLHFLSWADHAVPPIAEFYDFLKSYAFLRKQKPLSRVFGPTVVHCSAGVGRTGTFICAQTLLDQLRTNPRTIDVFGTVLALRVFRKRLVQVKEQLRFLYDFLDYCIREEGIPGCSPTLLQPRPPSLQFLTSGGPPPAYTPKGNTDGNANAPPQAIQLQPLPPRPASPLKARAPAPDLSVAETRAQAPVSPSYRRQSRRGLSHESCAARSDLSEVDRWQSLVTLVPFGASVVAAKPACQKASFMSVGELISHYRFM
ncbi:hypothetical protein SprV_0802632600 [Sparganum proliferum]